MINYLFLALFFNSVFYGLISVLNHILPVSGVVGSDVLVSIIKPPVVLVVPPTISSLFVPGFVVPMPTLPLKYATPVVDVAVEPTDNKPTVLKVDL